MKRMLETVRTLYGYSAWANQRVLEAAARLERERYFAPAGTSFGAVHDTLVHIMGAQWVWLQRWQGESPLALPQPADFPDLAALRARWDEVEAATVRFLESLDEAALQREVSYTNTRGRAFAFPLWQLMLHQVNHATQHRSEVAMALTGLGHSPGELDLLRYLARLAQR